MTGEPFGSDRSATKMDSLSTCGTFCAIWTSRARFTPTAAAAPARKAAAKTVLAFGR